MLGIVFSKASDMNQRRQESKEAHELIITMRKIFYAVLKWWNVIRKERELAKKLEEQAAKRKMESERNEESAF